MKKIVMAALLTASIIGSNAALAAESVLLDKIAGVINDNVTTLSDIQRIQETLEARKEISPLIYNQEQYTNKQVLTLIQHRFIVKDKLSELGFVVSDDSVESRVNETEKRLGLRREDLLNFLESKGITFNEYFELIREAMEYNIFNGRIISPLVNITDQEVKNYYYNLKSEKTALSFTYEIVDFSLPSNSILTSEKKRMPSVLEEYQKTGNLPEAYKNVETSNLGKVSGDDLPKDLSAMLKNTDEGAFSAPYERGGAVHVFYIKRKDLTESQDFLKHKEQIYSELFVKRSKTIIENWFSREALNYYILENI